MCQLLYGKHYVQSNPIFLLFLTFCSLLVSLAVTRLDFTNALIAI